MLGEGKAHRIGVDAMEPFDRDGVVALGEDSRALRRASLVDLLDARVAAGLRLHSPSEPVVAAAAAASIIVPKNVPTRLSFCAAARAAAAAALLTALSAMHLACLSSTSIPSEWTHSSSVVLDCDICRCSERRQPQSRCAMINFPALAFATAVDVMIGMLAVSASRASFSASSPAEVMRAMLFRTNTSTFERQLHALWASSQLAHFGNFVCPNQS